MIEAFLGTASGVVALSDGGPEPLGLDGLDVTALHAGGDALLAGTYGDGLWRSADRGDAWERVSASTFRFVDAEVAGLLRSDDGGATWVCEPVDGDEDIHHVTGHPDDPDRLYVSLGSASLSRDGRHHGGRTWERVETDYTRATIIPPTRPDLLRAEPDDWTWSSPLPPGTGAAVKSVAFG